MFLSKLILNLRNPKVRHDLSRPYEMHRTLMNGYPYQRVDNRNDLLFRVEPARSGSPVVLVQTRDDPRRWSGLSAGHLLGPAECTAFDLAVTAGQRLRFRLRANPTKRVAAKNERLGSVMVGKRVALESDAEQIRWLLRKGESGGFSIPGEWVPARQSETGQMIELPNFRVDALPEGRDRNDKPGFGGEFLAVRFEGVLVVTDAEAFGKTVTAGVGTGKAFGFGLLSLAPAKE